MIIINNNYNLKNLNLHFIIKCVNIQYIYVFLRTLHFAFSRASFPLIVQTISIGFLHCVLTQKQAVVPLVATTGNGVFVNWSAGLKTSL